MAAENHWPLGVCRMHVEYRLALMRHQPRHVIAAERAVDIGLLLVAGVLQDIVAHEAEGLAQIEARLWQMFGKRRCEWAVPGAAVRRGGANLGGEGNHRVLAGRLDPGNGRVKVFEAPNGPGPYGIAVAPDGAVYYASLAGSHIARVNVETSTATVIRPPTQGQGARRVWADSRGRIWVSEWNAGKLGVFDPVSGKWREWRLPGNSPQAYAVYVDEADRVWVSDFGANALVRFDPEKETFSSFALPSRGARVRQLLGRKGEVWGAESGADRLVVIRTTPAGGAGCTYR